MLARQPGNCEDRTNRWPGGTFVFARQSVPLNEEEQKAVARRRAVIRQERQHTHTPNGYHNTILMHLISGSLEKHKRSILEKLAQQLGP